jgi:hypothetical protein
MSRRFVEDNDVKTERDQTRRIETLERRDVATAGVSSDKTLAFVQAGAAAVWNINHGLNKFPAVQVVDAGGALILPDVTWPDANNVVVTFSVATAGKAYLN